MSVAWLSTNVSGVWFGCNASVAKFLIHFKSHLTGIQPFSTLPLMLRLLELHRDVKPGTFRELRPFRQRQTCPGGTDVTFHVN